MQIPNTITRYELAKYRVFAPQDIPKQPVMRSVRCTSCCATGLLLPSMTRCFTCNGTGFVARKDL